MTTISTGDTAWVLMSTALVALMVPGLAFFYGGLVRQKSALNTMLMSLGALAVVTVVFLQAILLGGIGLALGWRPHPAGLLLGAAIIALGTAGFVAMGLLLGGTLRAEIVLAVANLLWFVLAGLGALTMESGAIPRALSWVARLTPSGALTEALTQALSLSVDWFGVAVLVAWGTVSALAALRWFRFT